MTATPGLRLLLLAVTAALAALAVRSLLPLGVLVPGAVAVPGVFLSHWTAARILKRVRSPVWVYWGRPGLVPSLSGKSLSRLMGSGRHTELGVPSLSIAALFFQLTSFVTVFWLIHLGIQLGRTLFGLVP